MRREELIARIDIHVAAKNDAPWMSGLVTGTTNKDTEAMQLLKAILPEKIIAKIQVIETCALECQMIASLCYGLYCCSWSLVAAACKIAEAVG